MLSRSKSTIDSIISSINSVLDKKDSAGLSRVKLKELAGAGAGTLFQIFKNKDRIVEGVLLKITEENLNRMDIVLKELDPKDFKIDDIVSMVVKSQFETLEKIEKASSTFFQYTPQMIPHTHFKKADDKIIKFLIDKVSQYGIPIGPKNQEEAFFVCTQAVRSVMFMTFLNRKIEERETIMNELISMLTRYLGPVTR